MRTDIDVPERRQVSRWNCLMIMPRTHTRIILVAACLLIPIVAAGDDRTVVLNFVRSHCLDCHSCRTAVTRSRSVSAGSENQRTAQVGSGETTRSPRWQCCRAVAAAEIPHGYASALATFDFGVVEVVKPPAAQRSLTRSTPASPNIKTGQSTTCSCTAGCP